MFKLLVLVFAAILAVAAATPGYVSAYSAPVVSSYGAYGYSPVAYSAGFPHSYGYGYNGGYAAYPYAYGRYY